MSHSIINPSTGGHTIKFSLGQDKLQAQFEEMKYSGEAKMSRYVSVCVLV